MPNLLGKTRLRTILVVPFVLQIVGTVGLVGYLSFRNGQRAVNSLAVKLLDKSNDVVTQRLDRYLQTAQDINHLNAEAGEHYLEIAEIAGADTVLKKPFEAKWLLDAITVTRPKDRPAAPSHDE